MKDHFICESRYECPSRKSLSIRTSDGTEWTVFFDWLITQRKVPRVLNRITFRKENFYCKCYKIRVAIKFVCSYKESPTLLCEKDNRGVFTKFLIYESDFKRSLQIQSMLQCPCEKCCEKRRIWSDEFADILRYKITIEQDEVSTCDPETPNRENLFKFSDQISSTLKNGYFSDYTIRFKNVEEKVIKVHKNILSGRVPYFENQLSHVTRETLSNQIYFEEEIIASFEELLLFVYSGVLRPLLTTVLCDLMILADRFNLTKLQEKCSGIIIEHISYPNAATILNLPVTKLDTSLSKACIKFIAQNYLTVEKFDPNFKELDSEAEKAIDDIRNINFNPEDNVV